MDNPSSKLVEQIMQLPKPKVELPVTVIAVDGRGGSGKTTFANQLAKHIGAQIVHTDDFANWENKFNWTDEFISRIIEPIQNGTERLTYPRSRWAINKPRGPIVNQRVKPILVIEGVGATRSELRDFISYAIFFDATLERCYQGRIERERANPYYPHLTEMQKMQKWHTWVDEENIFFAKERPKEKADVILDGRVPFVEQLDRLNRSIERLLNRTAGDSNQLSINIG